MADSQLKTEWGGPQFWTQNYADHRMRVPVERARVPSMPAGEVRCTALTWQCRQTRCEIEQSINQSMGGCCAPGASSTSTTETPDSTAMKEQGREDVANQGFVVGESEQDDEYGGVTMESMQLEDAFRVQRSLISTHISKTDANEAEANMEELLQVLENTVEKEFLSLNSGHSNNANAVVTGDDGDGDDAGEDMGYYEHQYGEKNGNPSNEVSESYYSSAVTPVSSSLHSGASSGKETKSPGGSSSPSAGDWCSKELLVSGVSSKSISRGTTRTAGLDWGDRVEATLESLHDMKGERKYPPDEKPSSASNASTLTARSNEVIDKHFGDLDQILHQMMALDGPAHHSSVPRSNNASSASSAAAAAAAAASYPPRPPEILTEVDDYPRGSSDTNSEEAERERKEMCYSNQSTSSPVSSCFRAGHRPRASEQFEGHPHPSGARFVVASLESAGEACHNQQTALAQVGKGSTANGAALSFGDEYGRLTGRGAGGRGDESSCSPSAVASRAIERSGRGSTSIEVDTAEEFEERMRDTRSEESRPVSIRGAESYNNWLERHSKEFGRNNGSIHHDKREISGESNQPDEPKCARDAAGIDDDAALSGRQSDASSTIGVFPQRATEPPSSCSSSSSTSWKTCLQLRAASSSSSSHCSCQRGEQAQSGAVCLRVPSSEETSLVDSVMSRTALPPLNTPRSTFGKVSNPALLRLEEDWVEDDCGRWERKDLERAYGRGKDGFAGAAALSVPCNSSSIGGEEKQRLDSAPAGVSSRNQLEALPPSRGSSGDSRCSRVNSKHGTPKSVLAGRQALAKAPNVKQKVKVCVRMRPFNDHEKVCPLRQLLCVMGTKVIVKEYDRAAVRRSMDCGGDSETLEFRVDCVVDDSYLQKNTAGKKEESQRRMYESIGLPCLEYALDGYNTTILAYGQVGTGKTYTMMGDGTEEASGLMPRLGKDLMNQLKKDYRGEFNVQVSYLEIYQERIRDLLADQTSDSQGPRCGSVRTSSSSGHWCDYNSDAGTCDESGADFDTASNSSLCVGTPRGGTGTGSWRHSEHIRSVCFDPVPRRDFLRVREHPVTGPYVEGLQWRDVATWEELEALILQGAANRTFAATATNKCSSRGHTLLTIKLIRGGTRFIHGCPTTSFNLINLVDLAGTEKPQPTRRVPAERQDETRYINRSLAQLNDVILNLSRGKFVSFRGSALTWLLRDSLCKDSKLLLVATISPAEQDFQESVNTLRYASRASRIHSCGVGASHPDQKKQLFVSMRKEIQVLHNLVHDLTKNNSSNGNSGNSVSVDVQRSSTEMKRRPSRMSYTT